MNKTKNMTLLALLIAIEVVLIFTPLGFIPIGPIRATTLHIPVIVAGIMLGKKEGAILGFVFGLSSLINNTINPTIISFVFTPFITIGENQGNLFSLIIVFIPRILLGYFSGVTYERLSKKDSNLSIIVSTLVGSFTNTLLVLLGIYFFFGKAYSNTINIAYTTLLNYLITIIFTNSILEVIVACFIVLAVVKALKLTLRR